MCCTTCVCWSVLVFSSLIWNSLAVAPVINNLDNSTSISEDTTIETFLYTLSVTDTDTAASAITCSVGAASNPATSGNFFRLRQVPGTTDWGIYTLADVTFSYSTQNQYQLDVDCSDGTTTVDGTYTVLLTQNAAPAFDNLPNTTTLSSDAPISTLVFSVLVSDAENDQIFYDITCSPAGCPFTIFESGEIKLNGAVPASTVAYAVTVNASDTKNTITPLVLTVTITDINDSPAISNLGTTISVAENTAVSTSQVTTTCTDSDVNDTLAYSMTCTPSSGLTYFTINPTSGEISTSATSTANYETLLAAGATSFVCDVVCSDGTLSVTATVTFDVTNVNEAPVFGQNGYSVTIDEGPTGTVIHSAGYTIYDPDASDTKVFSLDCGTYTGYFALDTSTGNTNYSSDYDVDDGSRPSTVACNLTVTDSGGLNHTVDLSFYVNNINDNTPAFLPITYQWFVDYGATVSTTAGYVTATDADAGTFGVITFSLDQTPLGSDYFGISDTGQVYVVQNFSTLAYGATFTFNVTATDSGSQSDTAQISLVFVPTTTTSTTTTTDRNRTFFEDTRNVAWFSACILILLIITGVLLHIFFVTYNGSQLLSKIDFSKLNCECCRFERNYRVASPAPSVELELTADTIPPTPPSPPPKPPSQSFDFWHEHERVG